MRIFLHLMGVVFSLTLFQEEPSIDTFALGIKRGALQDPEIEEASGLVCSMKQPGYFWTHNDSGDQARFFLLDSVAQHRATFYLPGITARDWEDIATMEDGKKHYLLIGDIGDNRADHATITVHRVEEPEFQNRNLLYTDTVPANTVSSYTFRYEDGPRDAESLFFDPIDKKLYLISKREVAVGIYEATLPKKPHTEILLKRRGSIPYTFITSAAISPDGTEVLIKNLLHVYYWKRHPGESIPALFQRTGRELPYKAEAQGEAIAFARNGSGYYTLSERPLGLPAYLYFYPRK